MNPLPSEWKIFGTFAIALTIFAMFKDCESHYPSPVPQPVEADAGMDADSCDDVSEPDVEDLVSSR